MSQNLLQRKRFLKFLSENIQDSLKNNFRGNSKGISHWVRLDLVTETKGKHDEGVVFFYSFWIIDIRIDTEDHYLS